MPAGDPAGYLPNVRRRRAKLQQKMKQIRPGGGKMRYGRLIADPSRGTGGTLGPPPMKSGRPAPPKPGKRNPAPPKGANDNGRRIISPVKMPNAKKADELAKRRAALIRRMPKKRRNLRLH